MVIEPHRLEGVFLMKGKDDALVTKNMAPGESVRGRSEAPIQRARATTPKYFQC